MARHGHGIMKFMGQEKEPPAVYGGKDKGRHPPVHSHSARPKRHIKGGGKRGHKRSM